MIYITGDTHAAFNKFSTDLFPEQKSMSKNDFVIICGDFGGVWCDTNSERWWLDWLSKKNFTLLFVDGNHENFDRLYSGEFPVVDFHGGKAHKIRDGIYHLMRGYVYTLEDKKFFCFGGASSHDVKDGILDEKDYPNVDALVKDYNRRTRYGQMLRINHVSWWKQELPTEEEIKFAKQSLLENDNKVDFVVTHCAPKNIAAMLGYYEADNITDFFDELSRTVSFKKWFFGHYHDNKNVTPEFTLLYGHIMRIV